MIVSLVAAVAKNYVIGMGEAIPWKIPGEQIRFKELTTGKFVIMGRRTFESIGRPLPGRKTIVISRRQDYHIDNCAVVGTLEEALYLLKDEEEVFIGGGGQIYQEALPYVSKIYLTVIDHEFAGDVFFPNFNKDDFHITYEERKEAAIPYVYYTFERNNKVTALN